MAETKQYLAVPLTDYDLKAGEDGWQFTAYASTFNNRDAGGDIIDAKAFDATLRTRTWRPLLWQHDMREPIGIEKSIKADKRGLLGTWELIDTQRGTDAYKLLKRGAVRSMSIGYVPQEWEFQGKDGETRLLKSVDLLENSVVSIPMNEQAVVTQVKAGIDRNVPFEELIAQVQAAVLLGADEAEALAARRAEDERKLSTAHIDVLTLYAEELKGSIARVEAILSANRDAAPKGNATDATLALLALRRARERSRAARRTA